MRSGTPDWLEILRDLERSFAPEAQAQRGHESERSLEGLLELVRALMPVHELVEHLHSETALPPAEAGQTAARLLSMASAQAAHAPLVRRRLFESLAADLDVIDPVPHASVAQARRIVATRNRLLASGAWTVEALADARGTSRSTARTWLDRQRKAHRLVSVRVSGEAYVPALLLDPAAEPYVGADEVLRPLLEAGFDAWAVWLWLDAPSGWLDGRRPADLLAQGDVEKAARAGRTQAEGGAETRSVADVA